MMRVHWQAPQAGHHHFENEWSLELLHAVLLQTPQAGHHYFENEWSLELLHAVLLQTTALSERSSEKLCEC